MKLLLQRSKIRSDAYLLLLWLRRDLSSRYAGSIGGVFWALLLPLFTIAVFYVVFALVLKVRIPELAGETGYFFYLLAGLLAWLGISDGLVRAAGSLVAQEQFLQKIVFPVAVLPVTVVLSSLVPQLLGGGLFLVLLVYFDVFSWTILLWPLVFLCQLLMTTGAALALAIISVHVKDVMQFLPVVLQMMFYAAPILYPRSFIGENYRLLFLCNPVAGLVEAYQAVWLGLPLANASLIALLGWTVLLGGGGWLLFRSLKPTLGDYL